MAGRVAVWVVLGVLLGLARGFGPPRSSSLPSPVRGGAVRRVELRMELDDVIGEAEAAAEAAASLFFSSSSAFSPSADPAVSAHAAPAQRPDDAQSAAITTTDPAVLVVAGPGSGKTRVLSARMAYLLMEGMCSPSEILVLSFTNTAANNLCAKASVMMQNTVATTSGVVSDTFHGFCSSVIRTNFGQKNQKLIIADDEDQMRIMLALFESKSLPGGRSRATEVLRQIRYWKELGLGYLGVRPKTLVKDTERLAYELYPEYQARLKMLSAMDFGDLLLYTLRLFRKNPSVLSAYRSRFKHVLVDEFQDVSPAQYDILRMLVLGSTSASSANAAAAAALGGGSLDDYDGGILERDDEENANPFASSSHGAQHVVNVFCAGDDDQSIYAFRGAQVELMRRFRFDFPGSQVLKFDVSYRLYDSLCQVSSKVVSPLQKRISKTLVGQPLPALAAAATGSHLALGKLGAEKLKATRAGMVEAFVAANAAASASAMATASASGSGSGSGSAAAGAAAGVPGRGDFGDGDGDDDDVSALQQRSSQAVVEVRRMADEAQELDWIASYIKQLRKLREEAAVTSSAPLSYSTAAANVAAAAPFLIRPQPQHQPQHQSQHHQSLLPALDARDVSDVRSVAILARSVADVGRISASLAAHNIPFRSRGAWVLPAGGIAPLSLLRLVASPDDDVAFEAALDNDLIAASIPAAELARLVLPPIRQSARAKGSSLLAAARECVLTQSIKAPAHVRALTRFLRAYDGWRAEVQRFSSRGEAARRIVHSILTSAFAARAAAAAAGDGDASISRAIDELSRSASSFDSLQHFFGTIRSQGGYVLGGAGGAALGSQQAGLGGLRQGGMAAEGAGVSGLGVGLGAGVGAGAGASLEEDSTAADVASLWDSAVAPFNPQSDPATKTAAASAAASAAAAAAAAGVEVWVMSMYAAKGLEFDQVLLPFWTNTRIDASADGRRVAFVSLTRARRKVLVSYAGRRAPLLQAGAGAAGLAGLAAEDGVGAEGGMRMGMGIRAAASSATGSGSGLGSGEQYPSRLVLELMELTGLVRFEDVSVLQRLAGKTLPQSEGQAQGQGQRQAQGQAQAQTQPQAQALPVPFGQQRVGESFPSLSPGALDAFRRETSALAASASASASGPASDSAFASFVGSAAGAVAASAPAARKSRAKRAPAAAAPSKAAATTAKATATATTTTTATKGKAKGTTPSAPVATTSSSSGSGSSCSSKRVRAAAPGPQLPSPSSLSPQDVHRLVFDSRARATELKALFRAALAELGLTRGAIVVGAAGAAGESKALSKCTAEELGLHLSQLLLLKQAAGGR